MSEEMKQNVNVEQNEGEKAKSHDGLTDLAIEAETFLDARTMFNGMLQKLVKDMKEKNSGEGNIKLNVAVSIEDGMMPTFDYSVQTGIVLKNQEKGTIIPEASLYYDADSKKYRIKKLKTVQQMSLFDEDVQKAMGQTRKTDPDGLIVNDVVAESEKNSEDVKPEEDEEEDWRGEGSESSDDSGIQEDAGEEPMDRDAGHDALSDEASKGPDVEAEKNPEADETESHTLSVKDDLDGLFGDPIDDPEEAGAMEYPEPDLDN